MNEVLDALPEDRTITWGEAQFTINKMLPMEAKSVFMAHVRPLCQGILADVGEASESKEVSPVDWINDLIKPEKAGAAWKLIAAAFINAPYEHYLAISTAMSRSISVRRGQETRVLQGNEEWAFQGLRARMQ